MYHVHIIFVKNLLSCDCSSVSNWN